MILEYVDVVVIIPLEEELIEFFEVFPSLKDLSTDTCLTHFVDSGISDVRIVVIQQHGMGKTHAINATALMLSKYEAGLVVCLGIAGGVSDDMRLADVCYSGSIIDVLDNSKVVDVEDDGSDTELSPSHFRTPSEFTVAFNFVRTQPDLRPRYIQWQRERGAIAKTLVPNPVPSPGGSLAEIGEPNTKSGAIVCGAVSKSKLYNKKLRQIDRALLAVETESGGVFSQAGTYRSTPAITIRGISDYADKDKGTLEAVSKGGVRKLAASNAASFLKFQFGNPRFLSTLRARRTGRQSEITLTAPAVESDLLTDSMTLVRSEIDEALRKLSPEYRLQPKGYRLPLPRIRRSTEDSPDPVGRNAFTDPLDVKEGINLHERIFVNLPRTYPDQSLAWVMADDLLTAEVDERQVVPVVVDGEAVRGAKSDFESISGLKLNALQHLPGVRLAFIIENIPFNSKHRLDTIIRETEKYTGAKFIYIARGDSGIIAESDFVSRAGVVPFQMCSISFREIAHFIQKNFGMTGTESEVVALRLRDTFDRFDLDAHPTYFAGIPKETLSALLQANRRSELIQLAVDGFLTFLVAGDRADVALSRTTRARFLRRLVVEMHVEKRTFDQAALVQFTKSFADHHDFNIDPISFIQAFVEQGIIHFENDKVHVSLPFIESYLLASELGSDPKRAEEYFRVDDDDFDMATFDLYAEIGASEQLVRSIMAALKNSIDLMTPADPTPHILVTEELAPANILKPGRADALRKRLQSAFKSVQDGADKTNEKQQMIDLSDKIFEASGRQRQKVNGKANKAPADHLKPLHNASRHWAIAVVLLGSGAEHLDAQTKRALSTLIIQGAGPIVDEWTRSKLDIDFQGLKDELTSDDMINDLPGPLDIEEKRRFIVGLVDMIEYATLAGPLRRVVGFLCEQARHRVLATSVEKATSSGLFDRVLHGAWLADIDVAKGKEPLSAAMKALPMATFFRVTLASHYLSRVYWNHWKKDDRLFLLDAAEDAIRPLDVKIDRPQLKRMIERSTSGERDSDDS
jgi:nucleoside phosphorylase